ncbi:MAG TPA: transposase, partial [Terriglobales bacterium]|nr:transposase [Terriglobales bacterium]
DWSAVYRLFSRHRLPTLSIFSVIRRAVLQQLPAHAPLSVALDDTLLRKTGVRIPGVAWRRDPLGPPFQTNFVRAQRVLQLSADLPLAGGNHRMIPIAFSHAPTPVRPRPNASSQQQADYRQAARLARLSLLASQQIAALRQSLDAEPDGKLRPLHLFVDGGYTNRTVLKSLPANTVLIGRIRKDAKLYGLPPESQFPPGPGRPRHYGAPAPTPEQVRSDTTPWQTVPICLSGQAHQVRVKVRPNLLWRTAGLIHKLQLVVIAPLGYRLRKGSKLLYRQPAFLICTDPQMDLPTLLQGYVQRWDIEVNFREEKTLLGVGQAQVRHPNSVEDVPALQVASYAMLLLSMRRATALSPLDTLPPPKWASAQAPPRQSTQHGISQLRGEVWGRALGLTNFSDLLVSAPPHANPEKFRPHLPSALLYAKN